MTQRYDWFTILYDSSRAADADDATCRIKGHYTIIDGDHPDVERLEPGT